MPVAIGLWQNPAMSSELASRVDDLEIRLSFLDDTVIRLSDVLARQTRELESLRRALEQLGDELGGMRRDPLADPASEPPPPHY
jgi:SlyX protein